MAEAFFIMQVPKDYDGDPVPDADRVRRSLGLPEDTVGMMTAAEVRHVFNVTEAEYNGIRVSAVATAGLSNHVVAGDVLDNYPERRVVSDRRASRLAGTINIAIVSPVPLSEEGRTGGTGRPGRHRTRWPCSPLQGRTGWHTPAPGRT